MTAATEAEAEQFRDSANVTWPIGIGAGDAVYSVTGGHPAVFVIGADGRIAWHDARSRSRHDVQHLMEDVDGEIGRALEMARGRKAAAASVAR